MPVGITIRTTGLDGKLAAISFAPASGGPALSLGTHVLPYLYVNPSPYGTYTITVPSLGNTSYTLNVPNLTPTQAAYGATVATHYPGSYMVEDWARLRLHSDFNWYSYQRYLNGKWYLRRRRGCN